MSNRRFSRSARPQLSPAYDWQTASWTIIRSGDVSALIETCGLDAWPKLWVNLRASCSTDLSERFPEHVVDAWMGNTKKVRSKHYDRVTDDHFEQAGCMVASLVR